MTDQRLGFCRSALYLPASNARAVEKAKGLPADMIMLDLEDAVAPENKEDARLAAVSTSLAGFGSRLCAIRINGIGSEYFEADCNAVAGSGADYVVVPKVESARDVVQIGQVVSKPLLCMIETPAGIYAARDIAAQENVAGLIAGTNDLATELKMHPGAHRQGLELSLQMIVLAASASSKPCFDGVFNAIDNLDGLETECMQGYQFGFTGKTLIHPAQIEMANRCFMANDSEIEDAKALVEAAMGGAERFRGRMVETMHVEAAKLMIARAEAVGKE